MELAFEEKKMPYLSLVARQVLYQEETAESIGAGQQSGHGENCRLFRPGAASQQGLPDGSVTISGGVQARSSIRQRRRAACGVCMSICPFRSGWRIQT